MKRNRSKAISVIALMTAALLFSGCGNSDISDADTDESTEDQEIVNTDDENDEDGTDDDGDEQDPVIPDTPVSSETFVLDGYDVDAPIYLLDGNGTVINTFTREELQASVPKNNPDAYRFYNNDPDSGHATLVAEGDGFMFFSDFRKVTEDPAPQYNRVLFAVRESDLKIYDVWEGESGTYTKVDYYDSALYLDYTDYSDLEYFEIRMIYDEESDSFVNEQDPEIDELLDSFAGESITFNNPRELSCRRTLDECGYIVCNRTVYKYLLNSKGTMVHHSSLEDHYTTYYDNEYVYYINEDQDTCSLVRYDIRSGGTSVMYSCDGFISIQGVEDGKVYFSENVTGEEDYGISRNRMYVYDHASGTARLLYDAKSVPGASFSPGLAELTIFNGRIYYLDFEDGGLRWFCADSNEENVKPEDIGCPYTDIELFDYGTVSYVSGTFECPDCGTDLADAYAEYMILNDDVSPCSAEINEALKNYAEAFVARATDSAYNESPCEEHQEHPSWYQVTNDFNVFDIEIISDRYIAVNLSGYWYAEGAHGMPLRDQLLFDLETGAQMTIEDFYTESDEEFRRLVAEKTKEDYLSYEYGSPYFAEDADEAYDDAYNYCMFTGGTTEFTSEGMIYYFTPYSMGPYAAGYIDILIPYEDLLGRDTL